MGLGRLLVRFSVACSFLGGGSCRAASPGELVAGLECVGIETAADGVLVVLLRNHDLAEPPSVKRDAYAVNGKRPKRVGRQTLPIYEEKLVDPRRRRYPLILLHRIYLDVGAPLREGAAYEVRHPAGQTTLQFRASETVCESLQVNQVGYHPQAGRRRAYFCPWLGDLGPAEGEQPSVYRVEDAASGAVVFEGSWQPGDPDPSVGAPLWLADLGPLSKPGRYRVVVPGLGRSPEFGFGDAWMHHSFYVHARGLYHQRCGTALDKAHTPWARGACHQTLEVTEARPPAMIRERGKRTLPHVGGHHDAGDFDVRSHHTLVAGWLLSAFELFPDKFTDGQLDLPESGNGIPDLLDEALFSIAGWETLQEADGGVRAGFESDRHPAYGEHTAATDPLIYRTFARSAHTTLAGAGLFAYAARLVRPFDRERSEKLLERARKAWGFFEKHEKNKDWAWTEGATLFAACQLYLATGEEEYHRRFRACVPVVFGSEGAPPKWPQAYHGTFFNQASVEGGMVFTHYFAGYVLTGGGARARDAELVERLRREVVQRAQRTRVLLERRRGFPYASLKAWGESTAVGRWGDSLMHAFVLTGDAGYRDAACLLADWALGANPLGRCFTSGLGTRPPYVPLHLDSYPHLKAGRGPVPGLVVYGVTPQVGRSPYIQTVTRHAHPALSDRPLAWRYVDGWSVIGQNEFTVNETMAPNIFLHAALAPDRPLRGALFPIGGQAPPGGYPAPAVKR